MSTWVLSILLAVIFTAAGYGVGFLQLTDKDKRIESLEEQASSQSLTLQQARNDFNQCETEKQRLSDYIEENKGDKVVGLILKGLMMAL